MPRDGSVRLDDVTMRRGVFVVAGPNARTVLEPLVDVDLSNEAFPWMRAGTGECGYAEDVVMLRANYVGELGWELHHPIEYSASLFESLMEAGKPQGIRLVGGRALESLRLEKSYRAMIRDLGMDTSPLEAGLERFVATDKGDFVGRAAYLVHQQAGPERRFAVLDVEPGDADATGEESIYHGGELVGAVSSGGYSHNLHRLLVHAYLPVDLTIPGIDLEVSVLREHRPARVIAESPVDPRNKRPRGEY
jgi:dimethylglycine dehydrogenase